MIPKSGHRFSEKIMLHQYRCPARADRRNWYKTWRTLMRAHAVAFLFTLIALAPAHAQDAVRVELNTLENADNRCRMTFVIENKTGHAVDSLKLDIALFNADGAVYRRM